MWNLEKMVQTYLQSRYDDTDRRQEEKRTTEDEMFEWHHWLDGHEFEQIPGVGDGQGGLACCSPWDHKESDTTEWLNWTCIIMKGLEQRRTQPRIGAKVHRIQVLVDWSQLGQHHHSALHLGGGLSSCRTQRYIFMYVPWGWTRTLL